MKTRYVLTKDVEAAKQVKPALLKQSGSIKLSQAGELFCVFDMSDLSIYSPKYTFSQEEAELWFKEAI